VGGAIRAVDPAFDRNSSVGTGAPGVADPPRWLDTRRLLCAAEDRGSVSLIVAAEGARTQWLAPQPRTLSAYSVSSDGRAAAFVSSQPLRPPELSIVDVETGSERQLTEVNAPWCSSVTLSRPEHFTIETDPGVELDVWLMKPAAFADGEQYPLLLNVHGGPFTQYGYGFFDEFHVYTGAGFGVVFCNPRGSSGRTTAFGRSIIGELGGPDYRDVMAALDAALARAPWADRSRLAVMGGSYGGFMTTWTIGHDHRFRAAISERAVNDWYTMQGTSDIGATFNTAYLGDRATIEDDLDLLLRQSPLTTARDIRTPVLILHAEDDLRCPISQAEQLFVILKRLQRDVEFVRFPDENHEMSRSGRPGHRLDRLAVILEFLGRKLAAPAPITVPFALDPALRAL
jgi:dipeptidyl aminopeptidase/acylaminoacyl peptidase